MWNLLRKEDSRTTVKLSTVKERFCQEITGQLFCLESGLSAVRIRVECADGFFDIFIDIRVVGIFRVERRVRGCEGVEQLCRPEKSASYW
jgi:hypothetical protein